MAGATLAAGLAAFIFVGQIVGKWAEGGWVVLISFSVLIIAANGLLVSPIGYRYPQQIHRIVRDKARVQGAMASIVEWQSLRMQEYRYGLLIGIARFFGLFGVRRPVRYERPVFAGDYDHALHVDHPDAPSILESYLPKPAPPASAPPAGSAEPTSAGSTEPSPVRGQPSAGEGQQDQPPTPAKPQGDTS